jgi:uncharacterized protein (TIGR01777 family)
MSTILISGGTGLVGRTLTKALLDIGHDIIILTRDVSKAGTPTSRLRYAAWDPAAGTLDHEALLQADAIVHLAGAGVADQRWSKKRKREILNSRVMSGHLLSKALAENPHTVKTFITASAIGWYGPDPVLNKGNNSSQAFTEETPAFTDFLGDTCRQWEESTISIAEKVRRVCLRIGIVLTPEGGALKEFLKPIRFGLGAIMGSGTQVVSWIHCDDLVRMILFALEEKKMTGIYNAVAPVPVTNKELVMKLARQKRGGFFIPFPVPAFILKLMLGEMSIEILKSCTVSCAKVSNEGFIFMYPSMDAAVKSFV